MPQAMCGAPIGAGERVCVVGSDAALGQWDIRRAVQLSSSADAWPIHYTQRPVYVTVGPAVTYKYVVIPAQGQPRYETFDGVRSLSVVGRESMVDDALDVPPESGTVPFPSASAVDVRDSSSTPTDSPARVSHAGPGATPSSDNAEAGAGDSPRASRDGVASASATAHSAVGGRHGGQGAQQDGGAGSSGQNGRGGAAPTGSSSSRVKEKLSLNDQDSVLIVQYRLPVRLFKRAAASSSNGSIAPGDEGAAGATQAPSTPLPAATPSVSSIPQSPAVGGGTVGVVDLGPYNGWTAEWDEEALLAPKGGVVRALRSVRVKWIGTCPAHISQEDEEAVTRLLETMNCIPVFLPAETHRAFYDGYCRDTLWPVFHNIIDVYGEYPTRWWVRERQADRWKGYMDANGKFAVTVVENYHEGDLVWIQDFHLLLVPNLLARRHIAPTALFLHVPFPSSEIFRSLSVRDELLRGMLSADHIGFHLFEYARHFLTSCRRILGLTHSVRRGGLLAIEYQGREVLITVSHVGIEPSHLLSTFRASPTPILNAAGWRKRYSGAKIVGGIDSVERLKGVPLKLRAWELYLNTHPEEVGSAVMVQICIEDTVRPGDKQEESKQEILSLAERINARYSKQVPAHRTSAHGGADGQTVLLPAVHVEIRATPVPLQERLALWLATDVLVNTSIRDGLSLFPLEYTYVRGAEDCMLGARDAAAVKASNPEHPQAEFAAAALAACDGDLALLNPGILVLSEFTGGSRVLFGAIKVNPWRTNEVATAIAHALTVSQEEAFARAESNLQYVRGNTTAAWAERVLVDLKGAGKKGGAGRTYMGYGLGLGYRLMGFGASFRPLNTEHVLTAYRRSGHRLFVFDYGGTLNVRDSGETRQKAFESGLLHGKDAAPPLTAETKKALRILSEDPRNTVFIVSGKEKEVLAQAFASLPHVGLAAEHGFYFRWGAPRPAKAGSGAAQASKVGAVPKAGSGGPSGVNGELSTTLQPASDSFASPALGAAAASSRDSIEQPGSLVLGGGALGDNGQPWETCVPVLSSMDEWKGLACTIMEMYAARTNGTFILRKGSAVSWHYSDADPEFGSMQAKELQDHLTGVLAGYPVDVLSGHGYVEVRPKGVNKGAVLEIIMNKLEGKESSNSGPNTPSAAGVPPSPMVRASSGPSPSTSGNGSGVGMGGVLTGPGSVDRASPVPLAGAGAAMTPSSSLNNLRRTSSGFGRSFTGRPLEFILCVGDDQADEEMFTTVQRVRTIRLSEHRAALSKLSSTAAPAPAVAPPGAAGAPASVVADEPEPARTSKVAGPAGLQITEEGSADAAAATASGASPSGPLSGGSSAGGTLPAAMKSSALNPLSYTYYEYTVTVGKKPSAAQYFLDDTGQTEDVLRSIARVAAKELSGSNKVRTGSSLASGPLPVAGGGSGTAGAFPTTATQAPAAASSHTAGVSVQAALGTAARTGASLVRAGASGGLLSLPAGLHALAAGGHGGSGMGGIGLPGGRGPGARGMQPSQPAAAAATPVFFSSNALAALEAAATSVAYGGGGSGAGPGGAALQGAFSPGTAFFGAGTTGDLSSYWANFAGSTTNIAGLNTNIPLLDGTVFSRSSYSQVDAGGSGAGPSSSGGGATAGTASGGATAGLAISTSTPGRALGQLPGLLPGASVLNLASAGYGHGAHGSGSGGYGGSATASGSPQGSGSKLGAEAQGGVARTAAVNAGNPYAMAGLLAFSGGSTTRLSSSGAVAGHHLGRVAEGPEGGEVDEHGHASESDAEDGYSENEGEGGMGGHPSGSKRRLAAGASPGGVAGQRQSMGFSSGLGLGGPLQGPLTGGIGTSHVLPGGTDPAQAGMQGGVPQAGVGGHGLGPYCGGILQVQEEETLEF